jgi:acyl carrier protein
VTKDVKASILKLIAEQFGLANVHPKDRLIDDLRGDALDIIELVMLLEAKFNIIISDIEADKIKTVKDVVDCVIPAIAKKSVVTN